MVSMSIHHNLLGPIVPKKGLLMNETYPPRVALQRFNRLLKAMVKGMQTTPEISAQVENENCNDTRTPSHTSKDAYRKRERASRE